MVQDAGAQAEPPRSEMPRTQRAPAALALRARAPAARRLRRGGACGERSASRCIKRADLRIEIECLSDRPPLAVYSFDL